MSIALVSGSVPNRAGDNEWADHSIANDFEGICSFIETALRHYTKTHKDSLKNALSVNCESCGGRELVICSVPAVTPADNSQLLFGSPQLHLWFGQDIPLHVIAPRYPSELFGGISKDLASLVLSAGRCALKEVSNKFPDLSGLVLCPVLEPSRQIYIGTGMPQLPKGGPGVLMDAMSDSRSAAAWALPGGLAPAPRQVQEWIQRRIAGSSTPRQGRQPVVALTAEVSATWKLPVWCLLPRSDGLRPVNLLQPAVPPVIFPAASSKQPSALSAWSASTPAWQRDVASHKPIWQAAAALSSPAVASALREWGRLLMAADSQLAHLFGSKRCPVQALELHAAWQSTTPPSAATAVSKATPGSGAPHPLQQPAAGNAQAFNDSLWSAQADADVLSITATWPSGSSTSRALSPSSQGTPAGEAHIDKGVMGIRHVTPRAIGLPNSTPLWWACRVDSNNVSDCALAYLTGGLLHDTQRAFTLLTSDTAAAGNGKSVTMLDVALAAEAELTPQDRRAYTRAVAAAGRSSTAGSGSGSDKHALHTPVKGTLEQLEDALEGGAGATPAALRVSRVLGSALGGAARTLVAATAGAAMLPPAAALQRLVDDVFCPAQVGKGLLHCLGGEDKDALQGQPWGVKGAPPMGLAARLAMSAAALPGLSSVAVLWRMAVAALRARWDDATPLPHMPTVGKGGGESPLPPLPDHTACLLHQKLQLLQACIVHRAALRARHGVSATAHMSAATASGDKPHTGDAVSVGSGEGWDVELGSDSDDGASDENGSFATGSEGGGAGEAKLHSESEGAIGSDIDGSTSSGGAGGDPAVQARHPLRDMRLCGEAGGQMYAPVTLPDAAEYGCEDSLLQQAALLARLGAGADGARVRARLQTAGLRSDMSAFKAANPGCSLSDFVRWHSPRDWVGDITSHPQYDESLGGVPVPSKGGETAPRVAVDCGDLPAAEAAKCTVGTLSQRMSGQGGQLEQQEESSAEDSTLAADGAAAAPSHVWHVAWADAPPLPAWQQPPPIDVTGEGEKVLHFLETMSPSDIMVQLAALQLQSSAWLLRSAMDGMLQMGQGAQPSAAGEQRHSPETLARDVLAQFSELQRLVDRATGLAADAVLNSAVQGVMGGGGDESPRGSPVDVAASDLHHALDAMGAAVPHLADCETQVARMSALLTALGGGVATTGAHGAVHLAAGLLKPTAVFPAALLHPKAQHEVLWACIHRAADANKAAQEARRATVTQQAAAAAAATASNTAHTDAESASSSATASPRHVPIEELPPAMAAAWLAARLAKMEGRQAPGVWGECSASTLQIQQCCGPVFGSVLEAVQGALLRDAVQFPQRDPPAAQWSNSQEQATQASKWPQPIKVEMVCTSTEPCTVTGNGSLGAPCFPPPAAHRVYVESKNTEAQSTIAQRSLAENRAFEPSRLVQHGLDSVRIAFLQSQWQA